MIRIKLEAIAEHGEVTFSNGELQSFCIEVESLMRDYTIGWLVHYKKYELDPSPDHMPLMSHDIYGAILRHLAARYQDVPARGE
jgi:hypothetical protein